MNKRASPQQGSTGALVPRDNIQEWNYQPNNPPRVIVNVPVHLIDDCTKTTFFQNGCQFTGVQVVEVNIVEKNPSNQKAIQNEGSNQKGKN